MCCLAVGVFLINSMCLLGYAQPRWKQVDHQTIVWPIQSSQLPHADHIEMSGLYVSLWLQYAVDADAFSNLKRTLVFPSFRTVPNDTHSSLTYSFSDTDLPRIFINKHPMATTIFNGRHKKKLSQKTTDVQLDGLWKMVSQLHLPGTHSGEIEIERLIFPSVDQPVVVETITFRNQYPHAVEITMEGLLKEITLAHGLAVKGPHRVVISSDKAGTYTISPNREHTFSIFYMALREREPIPFLEAEKEEQKRRNRIREWASQLQLNTPNAVLNTAFHFAKIRATESIFKTRGGFAHGPGGLAYYAAVWANDQAEYANPFFGFLNDHIANASAMNSFRWFARYMNPEYKPIPSSIIAEGDGYWNGAGDRGDMAMIAYGASRFALAYGNPDSARVLMPLIEWCLEYCRRQINAEGVVASDSDELEGRFPAGDANLCTSALYYDALVSASLLTRSLELSLKKSNDYKTRAHQMQATIDRFFGADVEGFATYRYYKENQVLRSWICIPLTVGLYQRKQGTIDALFSPRLWTRDGLATEAGDKTFWDRSTLYAFRGVLAAGEVDRALPYLTAYTERRLLGDHVPYPVEAFPEGNQRHLSAESALYCRIFIEGLFGIRPMGLQDFSCTPHLPADWSFMELNHIRFLQTEISIQVERKKTGLKVTILEKNKKPFVTTIKNGETVHIKLNHL